MFFKKHLRSLYRDILRESLQLTRRHYKLWIFALFAGILQTGGLYDVVLASTAAMTQEAQMLLANGATAVSQTITAPMLTGMPGIYITLSGLLNALYGALILIAILGASVIAQGALVYGLSKHRGGQAPSFRECLTAGARRFWPVACLNIFTLGLTWLARFLVLIPYAYSVAHPSWLAIITYFLAFLVFLLAVFALTTVHLLTLNAMVLEEYTLWDAIIHAYRLFKKSWVMIVEIGALLFVVGCAVALVTVTLVMLAEIPLFLFLIFAALFRWIRLMEFGFGMGMGIFFLTLTVIGSACIMFQYAAWQILYLRINEGSASAKLHRWLHWLTGLLHLKAASRKP